MNALLTQQLELQKQMIDQLARNNNILEKIYLGTQTEDLFLDTPVSQPGPAQESLNLNGPYPTNDQTRIVKDKTRLTFRKERKGIKKEKIEF